MTAMSAPLLAALKTDLAVSGRWQMISAMTTFEEHGSVTIRNVTATLTCKARGLTLVFMLAGPADAAPTSLLLHYQGTPFETIDAVLIARINNAVAPLVALRNDELVEALTVPLA